jgi:hypothetical protein
MAVNTPKIQLRKPIVNSELDWGLRLNESLDILDDAILAGNLLGSGTITIFDDGSGNITISGSTSASSVEDVNSLTGSITLAGAGEVGVSIDGQTITISGTPHPTEAINPLVGSDGITVVSGSSVDTIQGFRTEFVNASGTLSSEIDADIATHAASASAHHTRYGKNENDALTGSDGITIVSGSNSIDVQGFQAEFVSASGSLQTQIDAVEGSDVDSINSSTGIVDIAGKGETVVTVEGQNIVVSGTDHIDTVSDALVGTGGITIISGSNTTTVSGFRD